MASYQELVNLVQQITDANGGDPSAVFNNLSRQDRQDVFGYLNSYNTKGSYDFTTGDTSIVIDGETYAPTLGTYSYKELNDGTLDGVTNQVPDTLIGTLRNQYPNLPPLNQDASMPSWVTDPSQGIVPKDLVLGGGKLTAPPAESRQEPAPSPSPSPEAPSPAPAPETPAPAPSPAPEAPAPEAPAPAPEPPITNNVGVVTQKDIENAHKDKGLSAPPMPSADKVPIMATTFAPAVPVKRDDLLKAAKDAGVSFDENDPKAVNDVIGMMYTHLPPDGVNTHWLPAYTTLFQGVPDELKSLMPNNGETSKSVETYMHNVGVVTSAVSTADKDGYTDPNEESFLVSPAEGWFYPAAVIEPKNTSSPYPGGPDVNHLGGTWEAIVAFRDAITPALTDAQKSLGRDMRTHTEQLVMNMGESDFMKKSDERIKTFLPTDGKGSEKGGGGLLDRIALIVHDTGKDASQQWLINFRDREKSARRQFSKLFEGRVQAGSDGATYVMLPYDKKIDAPKFDASTSDPSVMDKHAKAIKGTAPDKLSVIGETFVKPSEKKTPPTNPTPGSPAPGGPFSPGNRNPNANPAGTPNPGEKKEDKDLSDLLSRLGNQNGATPSIPTLPSMPSAQMPTIPGLNELGNAINPSNSNAPEGLDNLAQNEAAVPPSQIIPVSAVGAGVPRPGDRVRPNQLGADGKKLDKDGDGLMDEDALAQVAENTHPVDVPIKVGEQTYNPKFPDPRLGEMALNLADGTRDGNTLRILDAAAQSGMPMSDYGKYLDNPMDIKPGDILVGDDAGMYLGEGKVLHENGDVSDVRDTLQIEPPNKGVFRLELPDLPAAPLPDGDHLPAPPPDAEPAPEPVPSDTAQPALR